VMQKRREPGLARPFGRIIHPNEISWQTAPALSPALPLLTRVPHQSGPSLRTTRFLRRHRQYYAPIRHPAAPREWPPVVPRLTPPPPTMRSMLQGFSGSHELCAHMMWSPTPATQNQLAICAGSCVAFAQPGGLGSRVLPISWPNTHPARSLFTLSPCHYWSSDPKLATRRLASTYLGGTFTH